jgi:DNA-binding CsgD family transcriptional regulator
MSDLAKTVLEEPKPEQFLAHIVNRTLASINARAAVLGVIEREGFLDMVGTYGYEDSFVEPFMRIPLWTPMPITDAARLGQINIFYSPQEIIAKYPALTAANIVEDSITTCLPITFRNTVIGVIGFTTLKAPREGFEFSDETHALISLTGLYIRNLMANKKENSRDYVASLKSLTPRQKQIIQLFKEDLTTDQMAERLKYSSSTIKQDIIKIYSIFGVNNRMAVVQLAEKAGLS